MLSCQKHHFHLPEGLHYLNCAYMSPLSKTVEAAGIQGMRRKRVPSEITTDMFFEESNTLRELFTQLINGLDAQRVAIIPAASYGIAIAAQNTPVHPGQNIVLAHEQFPSNVYAWHRLQETKGVVIRTVTPPTKEQGRGEKWNNRLLEAIDAQTVIVTLGHVHWTDGTRFDLERIGQRAREVGAALIVDGTQSVGALPFDVQTVQPDALICAGYKWLLGPYSLGLAYFGPRYDGGVPLEEGWLARRGSEKFNKLVNYEAQHLPSALPYDVGERSNFTLLPMLIAALQQVLDWGPAAIQAYCYDLTPELISDIHTLGFTVEDTTWRGAHILGLRLPADLATSRVHTALQARNISISVRGSAIRVSPHVYNDTADIDALREALHACTT